MDGAPDMNTFMIKRLVLKDCYLHRVAIALMSGGILVGMALTISPGDTMPVMGLNLIVSLFIALTFYLPLSTVLSERTEKTLPFILSLPVSPADYTTAKILANIGLYLIPLAAVAIGSGIVLQGELGQMIEISAFHAHVVLLGFLLVFSIVLCFSLITESMGWTVALIVVVMFLGSNVLTQLLPRVPAARTFIADIADGGAEYFIAMGFEAGVIVLLLLITYGVQVRKRNFL